MASKPSLSISRVLRKGMQTSPILSCPPIGRTPRAYALTNNSPEEDTRHGLSDKDWHKGRYAGMLDEKLRLLDPGPSLVYLKQERELLHARRQLLKEQRRRRQTFDDDLRDVLQLIKWRQEVVMVRILEMMAYNNNQEGLADGGDGGGGGGGVMVGVGLFRATWDRIKLVLVRRWI
ncbi:hypothetical protein F4778DRAFT_776119 [Xylariomycetidae sp. FL2044]|nr:hypothetical protein F4778DRAFT_776119 [Xylariomycetidae sp. FL2044]